MKRIARTSLALGFVAAIAMGATACSSNGGNADAGASGDQEQTVIVGTSGLVRPYTYYDDNDELTGYDIEVLKLIDERLDNVAFEFQTAEFPALFPGLDSGRFSIVANNLSTTEERREKYDFSDPYIEAVFGIAQNPKNEVKNLTKIDQLAGKRTYGTPGLNYTKMLEAYNEEHPEKPIQIEYTEAELQQQFQDLAAGKIDFVFSEQVVFKGYGADAGLDVAFTPLDSDYLVDTYGTNLYSAFGFTRATDQSELIGQVNDELGKLIEDGTLTELSEEFFDGIDVTPKH